MDNAVATFGHFARIETSKFLSFLIDAGLELAFSIFTIAIFVRIELSIVTRVVTTFIVAIWIFFIRYAFLCAYILIFILFTQNPSVADFAGFDDAVSTNRFFFARFTPHEFFFGLSRFDGVAIDHFADIALLGRSDNAVAANRCTRGLARVEEAGQIEIEIRVSKLTFCVEQFDFVYTAIV